MSQDTPDDRDPMRQILELLPRLTAEQLGRLKLYEIGRVQRAKHEGLPGPKGPVGAQAVNKVN